MKKNKQIYLILVLFIFKINAQSGCTDPMANNYNSMSTTNDGSCTYNTTIIPVSESHNLPNTIQETSGLIEWNNFLYTHNDDSDTNIYKISKTNGTILETLPLSNVFNIDWEEIAQDANYIYLGDFGNNAGDRTNLKIYKVLKSSISTTPIIETINFSYSNQTDFTTLASNTSDFDCQAFIVTNNEILLFTKQWTTKKTSVYNLSKTPGTHTANLLTTIDVSGLISGATFLENYNFIALSGYSSVLTPFVYLIYDYNGTNFSNANKRKINFSLVSTQVESISTVNGLDFFMTNEKYVFPPIVSVAAKLHKFSLAQYTSNYINNLSLNFNTKYENISIFPNPVSNELNIKTDLELDYQYKIYDSAGRLILTDRLNNKKINVEKLNSGIYFLEVNDYRNKIKFTKI